MPPRTQQNLLWSLIEVPDDLGVYNVGGRLGAAGGPDTFWKLFSKMCSSNDILSKMAARVRVKVSSTSIEANHLSAADAVKNESKSITVMIGGGHDHGYSHLLGLQRGKKASTWGCINIDAHLDVRKPSPLITSGSPFYLALEEKLIQPQCFVEFGIRAAEPL